MTDDYDISSGFAKRKEMASDVADTIGDLIKRERYVYIPVLISYH